MIDLSSELCHDIHVYHEDRHVIKGQDDYVNVRLQVSLPK